MQRMRKLLRYEQDIKVGALLIMLANGGGSPVDLQLHQPQLSVTNFECVISAYQRERAQNSRGGSISSDGVTPAG